MSRYGAFRVLVEEQSGGEMPGFRGVPGRVGEAAVIRLCCGSWALATVALPEMRPCAPPPREASRVNYSSVSPLVILIRLRFTDTRKLRVTGTRSVKRLRVLLSKTPLYLHCGHLVVLKRPCWGSPLWLVPGVYPQFCGLAYEAPKAIGPILVVFKGENYPKSHRVVGKARG